MRDFEYGDQEIGRKEMIMAVPTMLVGAGTLTFPRLVAESSRGSDGAVAIVVSAAVALLFAWLAAKLAARFPKQTFFDFSCKIASKPVACLLTVLLAFHFVIVSAFATRGIAEASKLFMFPKTPIEVITLIFLLVVSYAVAGSRIGLLRLNLMFFPIVTLVILVTQFLTLPFFDPSNLKPVLTTSLPHLLLSAKASYLYFAGFGILLFYTTYMNRPKLAPKASVIGVLIAFALYELIYIFTIATLSQVVVKSTLFPTLAVAKEAQFPGNFMIRFETFFFTIFIMTIFNTAAMAFDVAVIAFGSVFRKLKKRTWIVILTPFIYLISVVPLNVSEMMVVKDYLVYISLFAEFAIPASLLMVAVLRGVKGHE